MRYLRNSCTKQGVFKVAHFNGIMEIYPRPTLVALVTEICKFWHQISYISAYVGDIADILAPNRGSFKVAQFNSIMEICPRSTLVAMVTKISQF